MSCTVQLTEVEMHKVIPFLHRLLADEEIDTNEIEAAVMLLPQKEQIEVLKVLEITTFSCNFEYGFPSHIQIKSYTNFAKRILEGFLQEYKEKEEFVFSLFNNYLASKQDKTIINEDNEDYEDNDDYENNVISLFG